MHRDNHDVKQTELNNIQDDLLVYKPSASFGNIFNVKS